jgi:four helix bundle protein
VANGEWGDRVAIHSFKDLEVWQMAMTLAADCYHLTARFPKEEIYSMTAQIRRAAASVPANIAEGHGRENTGAFIQFLRIAQGSLKELETHLLLAERVTSPRRIRWFPCWKRAREWAKCCVPL